MTIGGSSLHNGEAADLKMAASDGAAPAETDAQLAERLTQQREAVRNCLKASLQLGDLWYVVSVRWFEKWQEFVGYKKKYEKYTGKPDHHPGPIDNGDLLKDTGELKLSLINEEEYVLLHEAVWQQLSEYYGLAPGQRPIGRRVIKRGTYTHVLEVEVYSLALHLAHLDRELERSERHEFSKMQTFRDAEQKLREMFGLSAEAPLRLWTSAKGRSGDIETLESCDAKMDSIVQSGDWILAEEPDASGGGYTRPYENFTMAAASPPADVDVVGPTPTSTPATPGAIPLGPPPAPASSFWDRSDPNATPGLCGLANLGNTCFMNSALQCLSNMPPLTDYLLSDAWKADLNCDNPLGMRGEIAKAYSDLIRSIWAGTYTSIAPRAFKHAVGEFAPQFTGYQQQDCQELMGFLLDGLHEDLNRIRKKPYVEVKEADNRPDSVVAEEAWDNYKLRNDSAIVDLFHGLLKSTLVCPECEKVSVTFDPFCYLSVPLPCEQEQTMVVHYVSLDPAVVPLKCKVVVPASGTIADLCEALGRLLDVRPDCMVVGEVYVSKFYKVFSPADSYKHIVERDPIYAFALERPLAEPEPKLKCLYFLDDSSGQMYSYPSCFGVPLMLEFPDDRPVTHGSLREAIERRCARFLVSRQRRSAEADAFAGWWLSAPDADEPEPEMYSIYLTKSTHFVRDSALPVSFCGDEGDEDYEVEPEFKYVWLSFGKRARQRFFDEAAASESELHSSMSYQPPEKSITLHDCLDLFTSSETLGKKDAWHCPRCKKFQCATKKIDLWSLPAVLVIHLKRFSYDRVYRSKLEEAVDFPLRHMDFRQWVIQSNSPQPQAYDLLGVANHFGGLGGGHYTAYALNRNDANWYCYDDTRVTEMLPDDVVSKSAYVLFYLRSDVAAQTIGRQQQAPAEAEANGGAAA